MKFKITAAAILNLSLLFFVDFGHTVYFQWQPATSLQNFICQRQEAAVLLLSVQKFKMAAAAILDFMFVQCFGIRVCKT